MDGVLLVAGAGLATLAAGLVWRGLARGGKARNALLDTARLFSPDYFLADDGSGAMAVDKKSGKILLVQANLNQQILRFEEVLSVRLDEDGLVVTATRLSGCRGLSQEVLNRYLSDAAPNPAVGAEGREAAPSGDAAHSLRLTLKVAAPQAPSQEFYFLRRARGLSRSSQEYTRIRTQAERWCALLQVKIQQADEEERRRGAHCEAQAG
jgi:hypothetical protein